MGGKNPARLRARVSGWTHRAIRAQASARLSPSGRPARAISPSSSGHSPFAAGPASGNSNTFAAGPASGNSDTPNRQESCQLAPPNHSDKDVIIRSITQGRHGKAFFLPSGFETASELRVVATGQGRGSEIPSSSNSPKGRGEIVTSVSSRE